MMWQLMWRNVRAATLNAMFQLLVIYRFVGRGQLKIDICVPKKKSSQYFYNISTISFKFQVVTGFYWWGKKVILVGGSNQNQ